MSYNKAILIGNVGRDPEIRYVDTRPVASFPLATTEQARKRPDGTVIPQRTEWHNIVLWDANAEFAEKYIRKGTRLFVDGKISYRMWEDRNTIKHSITEIYAEKIEILGRQ
ncbi:MAG: single-stranded DNA-binding protein [Lachnoclostridium sp.]|nr:single-stranded DNA-binding protein [Lachnoclostridium sp.]